ncbi:MAG: hypothetical protein KAS32_01715 [Candidatus Peribacteraceae bacterium]|nr:hypothetical protein [Candidatus Peribacteraceae bacterium]
MSTEEHHIITPWEKTPEVLLTRISVNCSNINTVNILGSKPFNYYELLVFMLNEELRKIKHLHSASLPHIPYKNKNDFNTGYLNVSNYSTEKHIYILKYMLYNPLSYIRLNITADCKIEKVLYSKCIIDNVSSLD